MFLDEKSLEKYNILYSIHINHTVHLGLFMFIFSRDHFLNDSPHYLALFMIWILAETTHFPEIRNMYLACDWLKT